jgi:hypothetical protein
VVGELDAAAALFGAALGAQAAGEDATADERQVLELALERVVEEVALGRRRRLLLAPPGQGVEEARRQFASARGASALPSGSALRIASIT